MANENIYQLKVISGIDEEIYRIIKICGNNSLDDLSDAILDSFNFDHDHMYLFNMDMEPYGGNSYEISSSNGEKSTKALIDNVIEEDDQIFLYLYDFGDEWIFIIIVEKIEENECLKPKTIESKGKLSQYGDLDDDLDDDDDEYLGEDLLSYK